MKLLAWWREMDWKNPDQWSRRFGVPTGLGLFAVMTLLCGCHTPKVDGQYEPRPRRETGEVRPKVIQPDLTRWQKLKVGMTEAEVTALLGKPLRKNPRPPDDGTPDITTLYNWDYGEITFRSYSTTGDFYFLVSFHEGRVDSITDPWDGHFSTNGVPTVPEFVLPEAKKVFNHYPRFMDFRWQPSSGSYPMEYEIVIQMLAGDVNLKDTDGPGWTGAKEPGGQPAPEVEWPGFVIETHSFRTHDIYLPFTWGGANSGRWRVRAVNSQGVSDWTAWRYFKFLK